MTLKIGDKAPAFSLFSNAGEKVALKDFKGRSVILYFYPRDNTPGCTQQACDFRDSHKAVLKKKAVVFGISKDSVESHEKFKAKFDLPFALLSDPEGKMCEAYGVWQEKSLYGRKFMGIVRTTFVVGPNGKIAQIYSKVKVTGHIAQVLAELA